MFEWYSLYAPYIALGLAVLLVAALSWLLLLNVRLNRAVRHYQRITRGVDGGDLKWILERELWRIQEATEKTETLARRTDVLATVQERCVQRVGLVRFNPFQDTGGDQSFSLAMLDAHGDGLVLTGMYSRKETRFYAKPIRGNTSDYTLAPEELDAIQKAGAGQAA
jgi:hypothetical protein